MRNTPLKPVEPGLLRTRLQRAREYASTGQLAEAEAECRWVVQYQPQNGTALHLLGALSLQGGRPDTALPLLQRAFALMPTHAEAGYHLATALLAVGQVAEAAQTYTHVATLRPDFLAAHLNAGAAWLVCAQYDRAHTSFAHALALDPGNAELLYQTAVTCQMMGQLQEAIALYRRVIECDPNHARALNELGTLTFATGDPVEVCSYFARAVAAQPDFVEAQNNYAGALAGQGRLIEAIQHYRRTVALRPDYHVAHCNLGLLLLMLGDLAGAEAAFRQSIALEPDYAWAHYGLGQARLTCGDYAGGWPEYDWMARLPQQDRPRDYPCPRWQGEALAGKTILIHDQGCYGDTLQFVRFLPLVQARGGRVVLEHTPGLGRLLSGCAGIDRRIERDKRSPEALPPVAFDVHLNLLSLPVYLNITESTLPAEVPYLHVEQGQVERWRARFGERTGPRIGIVWSARNDFWRSCHLDDYAALAELPGVAWYSLQKGSAAQQTQQAGVRLPLTHLGAELEDFTDTAAAMQQLDLILTVDTATAHLAGGLGLPVWTLLPYGSDWRWGEGRNDCPWYPTMRLFRQTKPGDWSTVFAQVADALRTL